MTVCEYYKYFFTLTMETNQLKVGIVVGKIVVSSLIHSIKLVMCQIWGRDGSNKGYSKG